MELGIFVAGFVAVFFMISNLHRQTMNEFKDLKQMISNEIKKGR